jgi:tetratricopeptide (TPR) repeat protein
MLSKSKKTPNLWLFAILAISLAFLLVGCGRRNEPPPTPAPTSTPAPPTATPTPEPPTATPAPSASDHMDQGMAYHDQGELDKAIAEYNEVLKLEPDNPDAHRNLGSAYAEQGNLEEAVAAYEQAIKLNPKFGHAYGDLAGAYASLGKFPEAIEAGEKAIELDPDYASAYHNLGLAYKLQGQLDEAVAAYQEAIRIDPDFAKPHYNIGLVYHAQGQADQAIAEWQEAVRLDPNYTSAHKALGIGYAELGQPAEALAEFEIYLQLAPDAPDRAAVEDKIAELTAQIAEPSEEAAGQSAQSDAEPSLMDIDINRAPGHSIGFESSMEPGGTHRFAFQALPGGTIGAGVASASDMLISIQDEETGQALGAVPNNDNSLLVTIPQNGGYQIVIEDTGGQGGDYTAAFEASPEVSFALDPNYFIIGRLPEGKPLYYTLSAPDGTTIQGNVIPHPDTPVDLVVKIRDPQSLKTLLEANQSGPGENEQFTFTIPAGGNDKLLPYYVVSVEDAGQNKGAYILAVAGAAPTAATPATSPESVVQAIFDAATSGDFAPLKTLCDPLGGNDDDTQIICDLATDDTHQKEFVEYFAKGKVNGVAEISPDSTKAAVPILFGPDGDDEETMELINRDGQWYLFGF